MDRRGRMGRRRLVAGVTGAAIAACGAAVGLTVVSPASATDEPVVSDDCPPTGLLANGWPCVVPSPHCPEAEVLLDGTPCVLAVQERSQHPVLTTDAAAATTPEPTPEATPEATPEPTPDATPAPPSSEPAPAASAAPPPSQSAPQPKPAAEARSESDAGPAEQVVDVRRDARTPRTRLGTTIDVKSFARRQAERRRADRLARARRRAAARAERRAIAAAQRRFFTTDAPDVVPDSAPDVPEYLIPIYKEAEYLYQVPWQILAAINEIESAYGRNLGPSSAGALGWMQFMPGTWSAFGLDADGDGVRNPNSPRDAIFAAASYLQSSGAPYHLRKALFAYNHADWYVEAVLLRASQIGPVSPLVERLVKVGTSRLERRILKDERIKIYDCGRRDIKKHRIDRRVLLTLEYLASLDLAPTVTSLRCGHSPFTKSGNVSHHWTGTGVDIGALNGETINAAGQGPGSLTEEAVRALVALGGAVRPAQIISLIDVEGVDNVVPMGDHDDHIHIGWRPQPKQRRRALAAARAWRLRNSSAEVSFARFIAHKLRL